MAWTVGEIVISAFDAPTASAPALTPYALADVRGVTVAVTSTSSAAIVDERIFAETIGLMFTVVVEPPAAMEITPAATFAEPVVLVAVGVTDAATVRSPEICIVEFWT